MDLAMAQRLVDRRKAAGLSQEALAAQLGVSRQAVSKWERSESSPDTDNLIALAALYGVSLDELLYGEAASDVDTSADDDVDANNSGESEGAESSTEHVDSDGKPLVDISLARGIHVIDPNKGEEVHVGWNGIHVANKRKGEEVHVGPGGLHIDTLEDDGHSVHTNDAGTVTIGNSDVFAETKLEADQVKNLVDHEVAVVGMGPVVSKNVKVDDLSLEQLKGIFSGQITNWKEVGGDDATIVVLNRKAGSGTRATFEAAVFGDEAVDFKGDAELDKSGDVQTQMGSTDNAISYLDFSHFDDSKFNPIKVEGVEPKSKNVTDDSFKIWATEHMYCSKDADEATKAFLEFMLSDDVQGKLVEEQGFIPVSAMKVVKDASGKVSAK